jgi:chaperonin cofactor prefoldin
MTAENQPVIDPNTADRKTLTQLPGVGPKMALLIIAARPFASVDDLQQVNGIGPAFLERLRPLITVSESVESEEETPETAPQPELGAQPEVEAIPLEAEIQLEAEVVPSEAEIQPEAEEELPLEEPALVSRTRAFWVAFGIGTLAFILALVLSLGILANLNGGSLQFVSPSQLNELTREVDGLSTQIDTLNRGVEGLRTRLDNLEALSKHVSAVEEATEQLQGDVDAATTQVGTLDQQVDDLSTQVEKIDDLSAQVETLQAQSDHFQKFLSGLRDLVDNLFQPEEEK